VALLLVLATFGYLIREAIVAERGPPDVAVSLGQPVRGAGGHLVPVTAENHGAETAEEVQITVRLEGTAEPEDAVLVIPYLPRGSRRTGWVVFRGDPAAGTPRVAGIAYQAP
jgi:uncharacterized protein (TIGR02588 family)